MNNTAVNNAIEIKGLTKIYDDFKLDDVNITLPTGYIMGIIGQNGAGKTTTIKAMTGLIGYESGQVRLLGEDIKEADKSLKEHIGVVMDKCSFPEEANVKNIDSIMKGIYKTWDSKAFYGYVKRFGLPERKKIKNFSKGMKMKLSIAVALSHDSKLLILDEATGGLDPVVRDEFLDILRDFIQEEDNSVFISSHILSDLEKVCDYITFIHEGKVVFSSDKETVEETYAIVKCSERDFEAIDREAVVSFHKTGFGVEALVEKEKVNPAFVMDDVGIEDIMIMFSKEGKK